MAGTEGKSADAALPPGLRAVTADNASAMTGPGTTTYLLGEGAVAVIDPGPDDPQHLAAILAALAPGERIDAILVTHPHLDHSALAPRLRQATGAQVLGFGPPGSGRSAAMQRLAATGLVGGREGLDLEFAPDRQLVEGDVVSGPGWQLRALHTPGHMAEHLCFAWGDVLFSGDMVMAWAPSLVSPPDGDMGAYLASLGRLSQERWRLLLPTHGPRIGTPSDRIAELVAHRRKREAQILSALASGATQLSEIVAEVYRDTAPELHPAAARNALAHLIDLAEQNRVVADPFPAPAARFCLAR